MTNSKKRGHFCKFKNPPGRKFLGQRRGHVWGEQDVW
jgi:hypothetical protein